MLKFRRNREPTVPLDTVHRKGLAMAVSPIDAES